MKRKVIRRHRTFNLEITREGNRTQVVFFDLTRKDKKWKRIRYPTYASLARLERVANSDLMHIKTENDFATLDVWRRKMIEKTK